MSKMGKLNLALQEQAEELGYSTVQEALDDGYEVIHSGSMGQLLRKDGAINKKCLPLNVQAYLANEQEKAHEAWLEEKKSVLAGLKKVRNDLNSFGYDWAIKDAGIVERTIDFIYKGEV